MRKAPSIFSLSGLIDAIQSNHAEINGKWYPARPLGLDTLRSRLRAAWFAFTGKGDLVIWPAGQ